MVPGIVDPTQAEHLLQHDGALRVIRRDGHDLLRPNRRGHGQDRHEAQAAGCEAHTRVLSSLCSRARRACGRAIFRDGTDRAWP